MRVKALICLVMLTLISQTPANAITFGSEVKDASNSYSDVISIWSGHYQASAPEFICTGNLITSRIVLTAAHCVISKSEGFIYVGYGLNRLDENQELYKVSGSWRHPRYSQSKLVNDVGLLLLEQDIPSAGSRKLPTTGQIASIVKSKGLKYEIVGWGLDQNGEQATYLKRVAVADQTQVVSKMKSWINKVWIAVGKYNKTERIYAGACNGDSGGPLYAVSGAKRVLIGITSWGAKDCELGVPSVYTRLDYYLGDVTAGIRLLLINEKTDNRLPPPSFSSKTVINGVPTRYEWQQQNSLTCVPAKAGAKDTVRTEWHWSGEYSPLSTTPTLILGINDIKKRVISSGLNLVCETIATGPGGLVSTNTASVEIKASAPPEPIIEVGKFDHQATGGFARWLQTSITCGADPYPGQTVKWLISPYSLHDRGTYLDTAEEVVVGTGEVFQLSKSTILSMGIMMKTNSLSMIALNCAVTRTNAVGTRGSAEMSNIITDSMVWMWLALLGS